MSEITGNDIPKDKVDQAVFDVLKKEPDFALPAGFADRVVAMIDSEVTQKESRRDRWWLISGIVSMLFAFLYAAIAVDFSVKIGQFFSGYTGLVIFGLFFIAALHFVDKLILSKNRVER